MKIAQLFDYITPLTLVAVMGVIMIGYGFVHPNQENNVLQFFFGLPILLGALGAHYVVRRVLNGHTLRIWLVEAVLVVLAGAACSRM